MFLPGAGAEVGMGHLARCLALATAWTAAGGTADIVLRDGVSTEWSRRADDAGVALVTDTTDDRSWTIIDDYHASISRPPTGRLLVIDDHGSHGPVDTDLFLDQNIGARPSESRGRQLLGPRYALLRPEFSAPVSVARAPRQVLIAAGGCPTEPVRHFVDAVAQRLGDAGCDVVRLDGIDDVAGAMSRTTVAVAAAGGTAYELCATATPAILFSVADNQTPVVSGLSGLGAALGLGRDPTVDDVVEHALALLADVGHRAELAATASQVVDGRGAHRVAAQMRSFDIALHCATLDDRQRIFEWSNDPETRRNSFERAPIPWDDHVCWFDDQLARADRALYVASIDGVPLGQIRFADTDGVAVVSFSIVPAQRGRGWAAPLLIAGVERFRADRGDVRADCGDGGDLRVVGEVKPDNAASLAAFRTAAVPFVEVP